MLWSKNGVLEVAGKLLKCNNCMELPRFEKVVLNAGIGSESSKMMDSFVEVLTSIAGQRPRKTLCKKAVSSFGTRKGMHVGFMVTLRGKLMYSFLQKMIYIVFPTVRGFLGNSVKSISDNGNFSCGIRDVSLFPEVSYLNYVLGLNVTLVIKQSSCYKTYVLLREMGCVFYDEDKLFN